MTEITYARGTEADATGIMDVHYAAVSRTARLHYHDEVIENWSRPTDLERIERTAQAIRGGKELFVVAHKGAQVVGFGSIVPGNQELRGLYVHPLVGRRGVDTRILAMLEELAAESEMTEINLDASVNAEQFYAKHGFDVVERGVHVLSSGHRMACVKMRKLRTTGRTVPPEAGDPGTQ